MRKQKVTKLNKVFDAGRQNKFIYNSNFPCRKWFNLGGVLANSRLRINIVHVFDNTISQCINHNFNIHSISCAWTIWKNTFRKTPFLLTWFTLLTQTVQILFDFPATCISSYTLHWVFVKTWCWNYWHAISTQSLSKRDVISVFQ